jgi:hypothetical protein
MSGTIDPNTPLLVTLPARSWNGLLASANEGIQALAAVLADVQRQCMQQSMRAPDEAEHIRAQRGPQIQRRNGEAVEAP